MCLLNAVSASAETLILDALSLRDVLLMGGRRVVLLDSSPAVVVKASRRDQTCRRSISSKGFAMCFRAASPCARFFTIDNAICVRGVLLMRGRRLAKSWPLLVVFEEAIRLL